MKVRSLQFGKALSAALFVLLLSAVGMKKMYAYDFSAVCSTGQTLYYNITDATNHYVELTCPGNNNYSGFTKPTGDIILPETVQYEGITYSVTSIGKYAFYYCSGLTGSLTIPNSVTTLGMDAFSGCSGFTGSLTISNSVTTINQYAFYNCSGFTGNLIIGNSVTTIGFRAFSGCSGFTGSLIISNSVTTLDQYAFYNCRGFTGSLTLGNSLTTIGKYAFTNTGFTGNLIIPNSVTIIDYAAFSGCTGFTGDLLIPNSVTKIDAAAFADCTGFTGSLFIGNSVTTIGSSAFYNCKNFTGSLTIGSSVTTIGYSAFKNCTGFTGNLIIPNSVISIDEDAFCNCSGFRGSLIIGNSVTTIGNYAFGARHDGWGWNNYMQFSGDLIIPESVTYIGEGAFYICCGFTGSLTIPNSVSVIGSNAFCGCVFNGLNIDLTEIPSNFSNNISFGGNLNIGNSVTTIGNSAFSNCGFTGNLTIPNSVTTIGSSAFSNCGFTGKLTISNSVTTINDWTFSGCSFTGSLIIPDTVTTIGNYAFAYNSFTNLTIPDEVTTIGEYAFASCTGMGMGSTNNLVIPNSITTINEGTFQGCMFTSVIIPSSVSQIGHYAFSDSYTLSQIISKNPTPPAIEEDAFSSYEYSVVCVPCGTQTDYSNAFGWSQFLNIQDIPATLIVKANYESLGSVYIYQYGTCENPETIVEAWPNYSEISYYEFINWTVDGEEVSTDQYYTFQLTEDITLVANFGPSWGNHLFVGGYSNLWSDVENWLPQELPDEFSTVEIIANEVEVDEYASVATVVLSYGTMMTILPEGFLSVTESLNTPFVGGGGIIEEDKRDEYGYSIVIEEGGQLYHPNQGVIATVKKTITPYNQDTNDGWHLIASPLVSNTAVTAVNKMLSNNYDLYYYKEPTYSWMNQKFATNYFNELQNGKGYLYGNNQNVTLSFIGELQSGTTEVTLPLSYSETAGDLQGFNLVGNPFAYNVTWYDYDYEKVDYGCYVMNESKDDLIVSEISETNPLKPAEGFFVKATAEGASITFNPQRGKANAQQGTICVELTENGKLIDRLIVKREGEPLEKLSLNNSRTKLFAQGEHQELAIVPCKGNEQPVCFKAVKDGTYTIHVNVDGMEFDYLHLIDNLTGTDIDLLGGFPLCKGGQGDSTPASYTFTAKTTDNPSRFKLVFSTNAN